MVIDGWSIILDPEWRARRVNEGSGEYESCALRIPPGFGAMDEQAQATVIRESLKLHASKAS